LASILVLGKGILLLIFSIVANTFVVSTDFCDQLKADLADDTGIVVPEGRNCSYCEDSAVSIVSGNQATAYMIDAFPSVEARGDATGGQ
jgi:hypothetical protein